MLSLALLVGGSSPLAKAQSSWPFWDHYANRFLDAHGRVVDPDRNAMTTSEGQSYAMFFALVANDRQSFQNILAWTQENLAGGDLSKNLPAWSWGRNANGEWGVLDDNSASDSDLWIAFDLIEAGRLWGMPEYNRVGEGLLSLIARYEVVQIPNVGWALTPGKNGFHQGVTGWILNPSYFPLPVLLALSKAAPSGPWGKIATSLPEWLASVTPDGFAMDWVECDVKGCSPAIAPDKSSAHPQGSYDAIRVYLWAGLAAKGTPGARKLLETLAPMLRYVKAHSTPPERVAADGTVLSGPGPASFEAALIPFAAGSGDDAEAARLQRNVVAEISRSTGLLGSPPKYYDQNLALFALGSREQRFRFAPDGTLGVQWKK
jgi:endoglucanase